MRRSFILIALFCTIFIHVISADCGKTYTVKTGDTCFEIARVNGLNTEQLRQLNPSLNSACIIYPGNPLCVGGRNNNQQNSSNQESEVNPRNIDSNFQQNCPRAARYGSGPSYCVSPTDPNNKPTSEIESWFTREVFNDLFPKANLGWGPNICHPYSYESFIIAARYFPRFGTEAGIDYTLDQNTRRDLAAFFSHAIQETGENDASLYRGRSQQAADDCFYRGGFYNWFEGGPRSPFLSTRESQPSDGAECVNAGRYCASNAEINRSFPCGTATNGQNFKSCYFGRGAIQISYNYNYGQFQNWLKTQNIHVDLLDNPNLIMTKTDPPLAIMASLWFYMTPQPPKPAMHDIIVGNWNWGPQNAANGYGGAILGPTNLVINKECNGEDSAVPGGSGENRRIKAFKWFTKYFNVPAGSDRTLSCKYMTQKFSQMKFHTN